jgi:protoporphyrinogen oxidase
MDHFDTVIIGAGIAGLSAGSALDGEDCLIIEANDRLGGRVHSGRLAGRPCEFGATIGYNPEKVPSFVKSSPFIMETGEVAVLDGSNIVAADSPLDCLKLLSSSREGVADEVTASVDLSDYAGLVKALGGADPEVRRIVEGFFSAMHPGEMLSYHPRLMMDAFHRFYPSHHIGGNAELVDQMAERCSIRMGTRVTALREDEAGIILDCASGNETVSVHAQTIIIATEATIAADLVRGIDPGLAASLDKVRYGPFLCVAVALPVPVLNDISYVFTPERRSSVLLQRHFQDPALVHVGLLFSGRKGAEALQLTDDELQEYALALIDELSGSVGLSSRMLDFAVSRWPQGGTAVSADLLAVGGQWRSNSSKIILAGDYTARTCYGIAAAVQSGLAAAERLRGRTAEIKAVVQA